MLEPVSNTGLVVLAVMLVLIVLAGVLYQSRKK